MSRIRSSEWVARVGPGDGRARLEAALGPASELHCGPGWTLGLRTGPGEPCRIGEVESGFEVRLGYPAWSGSNVRTDSTVPALQAQGDPFGLCPVYYRSAGGAGECGSSLAVLRAGDRSASALDPAALHGYLCFSHVPAPLTLFAGCRTVPAGDLLRLTPGGVELESVPRWTEREPRTADLPVLAAELREHLRRAVRQQLGEEREAAVFLSGGLDSSLVAALLVEAGIRVHLFTLDFGPPWDAELPLARQVAEHLGRPLHGVPARGKEIAGALEPTAAALEQPFGDAVTVPLYLLGRAAAQHCFLAFNGEGGDQLFGGWTNKPMIAAELYAGEGYDRVGAYLQTYHRFWGRTESLYTRPTRERAARCDPAEWVRPALEAPGFRCLLHRLRAANLWLKGAQNIAPRSVQLAAVHGLRLRSPFFDPALTEWTFSLPPEVFLQGACEKYLLKRVAEAYLPEEVVWREKRGMGVPASDWCLGPLKRQVGHYLHPRRLKRDGLFEPAFVEALRRGQDQPGEFRSRRLGEKLWLLLMLHAWVEVHGIPLALP